MAAERYFANTMTLAIETEDDATSIPVGAIRGVEFVAEAEHVDYYDPSTIIRQDVNKHSFAVVGTARIGEFDIALIQEWLAGSTTALADGSVEDTNEVMLFQITGTITSSTGGQVSTAVVENCYFPSLPLWRAEENTWLEHELEFRGSTVSITEA